MAGPNGTVFTLAAGGYTAAVASVGAGLQSLTYRGLHLVLPFAQDEMAPAYSGKTLMPWPNRIADGRYTFGGRTFELPVNEHSTGSALHGLVVWEDWTPGEAGGDFVALNHTIFGSPGYPFQLALTAEYRLDADAGLSVTLAATNIGAEPAPYGASSHPYLTCGQAAVDDCELSIPAAQVLQVDGRLLPAGLTSTAGTRFDFTEPRTLGPDSLDHAFTGLPQEGWEVTLRNPATRLSSVLAADGGHGQSRWLQVYSGELRGRRGVAVEPMTCAPDAFNTGADLITLEPGQRHALSFSISGRQEA